MLSRHPRRNEVCDAVDRTIDRMQECDTEALKQVLEGLHVDIWDISLEDLWSIPFSLCANLESLISRTLSTLPPSDSELRILLAALQQVAGTVLISIAKELETNEEGE